MGDWDQAPDPGQGAISASVKSAELEGNLGCQVSLLPSLAG